MKIDLEKMQNFFEKIGKDRFVIILLVGILLLVLFIPTGDNSTIGIKKTSKTSDEESETQQIKNSISEDNQEKEIEKKMETVFSQVDGAGKVEVMVTLDSDGENIVEKDTPQTRESTSESDSTGGTRTILNLSETESTVYSTNDSGGQIPYVSKTIKPSIRGVVIVAQGGGNAVVAKNLTEAAEALFQIESHKIKVMKMKNLN